MLILASAIPALLVLAVVGVVFLFTGGVVGVTVATLWFGYKMAFLSIRDIVGRLGSLGGPDGSKG